MISTGIVRFSIGARMLAAFLAITILTSAIVVVAIVRLIGLETELHELVDEELPELNATWQVRALLSELETDLHQISIGRDVPENRDRIRNLQVEIPKALQAFREIHDSLWVDNDHIYTDVVTQYQLFDDTIERVISFVEQGLRADAQKLITGELEDRRLATAESLIRLLNFENRETELMAALALEKGRQSRVMITGLLMAGMALSVILAFAMTRFLTRPITQLVNSMEKVSSGDLSFRTNIVRNDEIGLLSGRFNEMLEQISKLQSDQKQFYSNASHELRTPLTVIRGEAEVALRNPQSAEGYRDALRNINAGASQMGRLVDELLFLVRTEAGQLEYEIGEVALGQVLREVIDSFEALATLEELNLLFNEENSSTFVLGDRVRLTQLFFNLIDNAIKYTESGGEVQITCTVLMDSLEVSVADNGIGIASEELPHVFERFFRGGTAKSTLASGIGLGLPIVESITRAHGGRVDVESIVGKGTTVRVTLPLAAKTTERNDAPTTS